jgi:hypothetical protein
MAGYAQNGHDVEALRLFFSTYAGSWCEVRLKDVF